MRILEKVCLRLSQRYLLAGMLICGVMLITLNCVNFNLMVNFMTYLDRVPVKVTECYDEGKETNNNRTFGYEEFVWSSRTQFVIWAGWPVGYFMGQLPTGLTIDRYGAKTLFGYSVFISGICTLLTPICIRTSSYIMLANRILMGIFASAQLPSVAWFAARWFPPEYLGVQIALSSLGFPLGYIWNFYLGHLLKDVNVRKNWPSLYHVTGAVTVFWVYFWQALVWDDPFDHRYINLRELEKIFDGVPMFANGTELEPGWIWPWKAIFFSSSLWTLVIAEIGFLWFFNFAVVVIPNVYFPQLHNYHLSKHPVLGSLLYLSLALTILAVGSICDILLRSRIFFVTHVIKINYTISAVLGSIFVLGVLHSNCNMPTIFIYYFFVIICVGFGFTNNMRACLSLAPNFAATLVALVTFLAIMTSHLQVIVVQIVTEDETLNQWKTLGILNAIICIFTTAVFLKWGNCKLETWNKPTPKIDRVIDYKSESGDELVALNQDGNKKVSNHLLKVSRSKEQLQSTETESENVQFFPEKTPSSVA